MENTSKAIYPLCGRANYMVGIYSDIAVENYKNASSIYKEMELVNFRTLALEKQYENFYHSSMICVVFSAMAIEAFINNYGAACLGDDFFYENFDRLSVIGKFQLISKFLFKKEIDKSKEYYYCLKTTFSVRDKLVHSKTISVHDYFAKKGCVIHDNLEDALESLKHVCCDLALDQEDITEDLKLSHNAINAMKKIADYFDENDINIHAMSSFFRIGGSYDYKPSEFYDIYKEFGIV